jgi:2-octaprenylphenol hydroxylase
MSRRFDVVIVGAGAVGMTMAALLAARKQTLPQRVAIVAAQLPRPAVSVERDWDLRVFALSRASQRLLQLCGIWQRIAPERAFGYERMCVWDARGAAEGAGSLSFDCAEIGEPNLGTIVDGQALNQACLEAVSAAGITLLEGSVRALDIGAAEARLVLADGRDLAAGLLIAADGTGSRTRELLGIEAAGHAYHQDALVAHVRTAKPHRRTAWQRFLPGGPLAFLPLPDGRSSIVWSVPREEARRLRALEPAAFATALEEASDGFLGAIELTTPVAGFPLILQYALEYTKPRAALVGDAGHAVHPLAGQGLNLGLLDCAALAEVLSSASSPEHWGEHRRLRGYERWRKSENLLAATALDGLERLFSSANPAVARLRLVGLGAVERVPMLKSRLVRRALGLVGDLPEFLRVET